MAVTRSEHMAWCKERALELVADGDLTGAFASLGSDFRKHADTNDSAMFMLASVGMLDHTGTAAEARRFIEGFA